MSDHGTDAPACHCNAHRPWDGTPAVTFLIKPGEPVWRLEADRG